MSSRSQTRAPRLRPAPHRLPGAIPRAWLPLHSEREAAPGHETIIGRDGLPADGVRSSTDRSQAQARNHRLPVQVTQVHATATFVHTMLADVPHAYRASVRVEFVVKPGPDHCG